MERNETKWKYMFMFPLKNLARKGLILKSSVSGGNEYISERTKSQ